MTNMDTAPQPVNDEQDQGANAPEPITIKAEGPFGVISWTPGEHTQEHLQELDEEGRLEGYLEFARGQLSNTGAMISMVLCFDKNPISVISALLSTDAQEMPPYGTPLMFDLGDETFEDIINGRYPRA